MSTGYVTNRPAGVGDIQVNFHPSSAYVQLCLRGDGGPGDECFLDLSISEGKALIEDLTIAVNRCLDQEREAVATLIKEGA